MKILHFILGRASIHTSNGVNKVIHGLNKYSSRHGHEVRVIGVSTSSKEEFHEIERDGFKVEVFNKFKGRCFEALKKAAKEVDIVHLHSVWNKYNIDFGKYLIQQKIPYVITVHSGLTEDRLKQSKYWFKLGYHYLVQKKIFDQATGIHAITREEITAMSRYIDNKHIFYVPNGLDLEFPEVKDHAVLQASQKEHGTTMNFGYLGRISVEKNIGGLIEAIALLPAAMQSKIKCYLIGPDDNEEAQKMKNMVTAKGLTGQIIFTGSLYGDDKYKRLKSLDFYVHPAFSDVVSIAVKEAMFCKLPSVITRTSDVAYYYNTNAFVMVEPQPKDISRGIMEMIERKEEWKGMGQNAYELVEQVFNWDKVVPRMIEAYEKTLEHA